MITIADIVSPLLSAVKFMLSIFWPRTARPQKRLEARLMMRGIVSELPEDIPFYICDDNGLRHKGVYAIGLLLWNKGEQPISQADLLEAAPLQVRVGTDARLIGARAVSIEDQMACSTAVIGHQVLSLSFDCINPDEYIVLSLFLTGNPMTSVQVTGRIIGQNHPIDHTAEEVMASIGERLSAAFLLVLLANMLPGFFIGGGLIAKNYGLSILWHDADRIPKYLMIPFGMGTMLLLMFAFSRVMYWRERKKYPKGYPLYADLEPSLIENARGMMRTAFQGKKQRISMSLFDWGKPVVMPDKKIKKRTIDDWIR